MSQFNLQAFHQNSNFPVENSKIPMLYVIVSTPVMATMDFDKWGKIYPKMAMALGE